MRQFAALLFVPAFLAAQEPVDLAVVNRIKAEAFQNSQVMDTAFYLTDVYGPRLTGSPGLKKAGDWAVARMNQWGLSNPHTEAWGPFGRGWQNVRFSAHLRTPEYAPLIGFARPWSPGTKGLVSGEPILAPIHTEADFAKWKGKLRGKMVMTGEYRALLPQVASTYKRLDAADLERIAAVDPSVPRPPIDMGPRRRLRNAINRFLADEGVLLTIVPSSKRDTANAAELNPLTEGGTVFGNQSGSADPKDPPSPPSASLSTEHYDRIARLLEHKIPVTVEFDIENQFFDSPTDSFNVIAEIPGTTKPDEIVMVGGHIDSWSFATGATDNGAGTAVAMEVVRILKALNLKMDRTVRVGLWSGEEQGLLGSRGYVAQHFGDTQTMTVKPEQAKVSGYFNLDGGTGKIRGVYLQNNDMMRPVFEAWLAPFKDMGVTTVTSRDTGSTDHVSFDAIGIPGFEFIQDPVEYGYRTHHSNMDTYDRLQAADLMQASAVMATVVYQAATRPGMLPRKPLPRPRPVRPN
jgi:carboxypeptidase Q